MSTETRPRSAALDELDATDPLRGALTLAQMRLNICDTEELNAEYAISQSLYGIVDHARRVWNGDSNLYRLEKARVILDDAARLVATLEEITGVNS